MSNAAEVELFGNDDWSVQADGIEHRGTGYFIAREVLSARRAEGLWDWPLQMAEKRWCRPSLFREAFLAALDRFGIGRDADLLRSFALGYGIRAVVSPAAEAFVTLGDVLQLREDRDAVRAAARQPARALIAAGA
ncbi:hypothetical protein MMSR116_14000 [Methylobacterium mesophilicum SR1.6/6]|uniref:Uncharacterized protein n=1 Tax=Methylobacterium mesophilicum SR1.6/6 TaxID=908290 RepID=A0A6B9FJX0_9HYPH|nr:hypothetical protein [Methylobacterium mesophilicum]QGY02870.1 hypothetical protein MMSR116_14000 [Methylobacterium mesophilicum SR1.6/6]